MRALIPFMVPSTVQIYPFAKALARIHNRAPVIYIHATDAAANFPTFSPSGVHLLRMTVSGNIRTIPVTSGITVFSYKATPPSKVEMPITVTQLSHSMLRLVPRHPLPSGEYIITIGPAGGDGFEFGIDCNETQLN